MGGNVVAIGPAEDPESAAQYFYGVGDIVFNVTANPREWAVGALSKLP